MKEHEEVSIEEYRRQTRSAPQDALDLLNQTFYEALYEARKAGVSADAVRASFARHWQGAFPDAK
jgi:hypothetical protein